MPSHRETDLAMIFSRLTLARAYLPKMDLADRLPAMKPHSPCRAMFSRTNSVWFMLT